MNGLPKAMLNTIKSKKNRRTFSHKQSAWVSTIPPGLNYILFGSYDAIRVHNETGINRSIAFRVATTTKFYSSTNRVWIVTDLWTS